MGPWTEFRKGLDLEPGLVFLNTAATSPTHRATREAMRRFEEDRGRRAEEGWDDWVADVEAARRSIGRYFQADGKEVAFLSNTGHGINTVAHMLPWRRGDEVIVNDLEFPSNLLPWQRLSSLGVRVVTVGSKKGRLEPKELVGAITKRTRLMALSWVSYRTGQRQELRPIADALHDADALLFVDAIQGAGGVRPDFRGDGIDFLACGGHKWMMAPFGVGVFLVAQHLIEHFEPPLPGWQSREDPDDFSITNRTWASSARRFEAGNLNYGGIAGWKAAVEAIEATDGAERRVAALATWARELALENGLSVLTPGPERERAGITCVRVRDPVKAKAVLRAHGVSVSVRGECIRVSTHFWNREDEVERCVRLLADLERGVVSAASPGPKAF